jgi:hypothetical protein
MDRLAPALHEPGHDEPAQRQAKSASRPARFRLLRLLEPFLSQVVVHSPTEIPPGISAQSLGVIR